MEWVKIEGKRCEARLKIEHVRAFRYRIRSKGCSRVVLEELYKMYGEKG